MLPLKLNLSKIKNHFFGDRVTFPYKGKWSHLWQETKKFVEFVGNDDINYKWHAWNAYFWKRILNS